MNRQSALKCQGNRSKGGLVQVWPEVWLGKADNHFIELALAGNTQDIITKHMRSNRGVLLALIAKNCLRFVYNAKRKYKQTLLLNKMRGHVFNIQGIRRKIS